MRRFMTGLSCGCLAAAAGFALSAPATPPADAIGRPVLDGAGNRIGEVKDTLPAPAANGVGHLVVDFEPGWHDGEGWLAVPWTSFVRKGDAFVANFDADDIRPATAAAAPKPPPDPALEDRDARLSVLMRAAVTDSRGEPLGAVEDLVIDMEAGRIVQVLVAPTPGAPAIACVLGAGGLSIDRDRFLLPAEAATLAGAGSCRAAGPPRTGRMLASRMLRTALVDSEGDVVGAFAEVVVRARDGALHYAIGDFGPAWLLDGLVAALPLRPLTEVDGGLRMVAYMADLHRMPVFAEARIKDVWSPLFSKGIDKYLGALAPGRTGAAR